MNRRICVDGKLVVRNEDEGNTVAKQHTGGEE
jgi:hypothetical protein